LRREGFYSSQLILPLRETHWLRFTAEDSFDRALADLVAALNTNLDRVKTHTRLLVKAVDWEKKLRDESLLLRGRELADAETWLANSEAPGPDPTGLQREYINASRSRQDAQARAERRLRRGAFGGVLAAALGLAVATGAGWFARARTLQAQETVRQAKREVMDIEQQVKKAERQVELADQRAQSADQQVQLAEARIQSLNQQVETAEQQVKTAEQRVQDAEQRVLTAEQRVQDAEQLVALAEQRVRDAAQQVLAAQQTAAEAERLQQEAEANRRQAENELLLAQGNLLKVQNDLEREQHELQLALQGNRLERNATNLLSQLGAFTNRENAVRLLIQAIAIGQELQHLIQAESLTLENYPATSPLTTLQTPLEYLNELDRARAPQLNQANSEELFTKVDAALTSISHSADGQYLALGDSTGRIQIYARSPKRPISAFAAETGAITDLALSPNGQQLVVLGNDGTLKVWNQAGDNIGIFRDANGLIFGFALSQNGQFLATRDGTGKVKIWPWSWQTLSALRDARAFTASPIQTVDLEQDRISSMSFSPDNASLTTTDQDGTLSIQPLRDSRKQSPSFESFQAQVRQVLLSPDASRIAIVGQNGIVTIWNRSGRQLSYIRHFKDRATDASFDASGEYLAVAYEDGSARLHKMRNLNDLIDQGCTMLEPYRQEYMEVNEVCSR